MPGPEPDGEIRGGRVGVDVVRALRADAERSDYGNEPTIPQALDEARLDPHDPPHPPEVRDGLDHQRRPVGAGYARRRNPEARQPAREVLVDAAGEHDLGDLQRGLVRHPQPGVKTGGDPELVEHPGELDATTVHHDNPVAGRQEIGQVFERSTSQSAAPYLYDDGLRGAHVL